MHKDLASTADQIDAMQSIRDMAHNQGFTHEQCFAYSPFYIHFEANRVSLYYQFNIVYYSLCYD